MRTYTTTSVLGAVVLLLLLEIRLETRGLAQYETA